MRVPALLLTTLACLNIGCSKSREPVQSRSAPLHADPTVLELAADLNDAGPQYGAGSGHLTPAGDALFYTQYEPDTGTELWKLDEATAGTALVKDLSPGGTSPGFTELIEFKGRLFFTSYDGHPSLLWSSDGSVSGTSPLLSAPPSSPAATSKLTPSGDTLFFSADARGFGTELWKTDGTSAGTQQVRDLNIGWGSSNPSLLTPRPGGIYFVADDGSGPALWTSDGTEAGTVQLARVPVSEMTVLGTRLFFNATDAQGTELWISDGTPSGTHLLKDIAPGAASASPTHLTAVDATLFFAADDGVNGPSLWKSDGTAAGTVLVRAVRPGVAVDSPLFFRAVDGRLVFSACANPAGCELWVSDGTSEGTQLLVDASVGGSTSYTEAVSLDGTLYLTEPTGIWATDGTPATTRKVFDILGSRDLTAFHHRLYFFFGNDLYVSNGTSAGTGPVTTLGFSRGSTPSGGWVDGERMFVVANDGHSETRLFVDDGSDAGVTAISNPLSRVSASQDFVPCGGWDFFLGWANDSGWEVWQTNGTSSGTRLSVDFYPGAGTSSPSDLICFQGALYFSGQDLAGAHFVRLDPSSDAVTLLADVRAADDTPGNKAVVLYNGAMFFSASTPGAEGLWRSDGTQAGTTLAVPLGTGSVTSPPSYLVLMKGELYFVAHGSNGFAVWRTDGTAAGTTEAGRLQTTLFNPRPVQMSATQNALYVAMQQTFAGTSTELFRSDGTPSGTYRLATLGYSEISPSLTPLDELLFFRAPNPVTGGDALWRSDGTRAGTGVLKDLSFLGATVPFNGKLFTLDPERRVVFTAWTPETGSELWVSDGTSEGTRPAADLSPGPLPSMANPLFRRGDWVYFAGDDHLVGDELWRISVPFLADDAPPSLSCPADVTVEAIGASGQPVSFPLPAASDAYPLSPEVVASPAPGSVFPIGSTPVQVSAQDWAGNPADCSFTVTVADTTPPDLVCPADVTVEATACEGGLLALPSMSVVDAVGVQGVSSSPVSGSFFPVGTTPVTVTAVDLAANASTCTFQVNVTAPPRCSNGVDAGETDPEDGGTSVDAGVVDGGTSMDAGVAEDGGSTLDAGVADGGSTDQDAGPRGTTVGPSSGGGCSAAGPGLPASMLLLLLVFTRRRRYRSVA